MMEVGYVLRKEARSGDDILKWFEMSIRVPFGSCTFTMAKRKERDGDAQNSPDFDLWFSPNRKGEKFDRMKAGNLWLKESQNGNPYLSGYIESPLVQNGKMYISVVKYVHQEGMPLQPYLYKVLWSAPQAHGGGNDDYSGYAGAPATAPNQNPNNPHATRGNTSTQEQPEPNMPEIDINEEEIPF